MHINQPKNRTVSVVLKVPSTITLSDVLLFLATSLGASCPFLLVTPRFAFLKLLRVAFK